MDDSITLDDPHTVPTRYWHSLEDGTVQCDVCPRACRPQRVVGYGAFAIFASRVS